MSKVNYEVNKEAEKSEGSNKIYWAYREMPVLALIRERFKKGKPLAGINISGCLHITTETANLAITLKEGGARVALCASNPLSTCDEVAHSLVKDHDISVFAVYGESREMYYRHAHQTLDNIPHITMDDGGDLVSTIHKERKELMETILGGTEETTTGVHRFENMEREGVLKYPIIAVNDAYTKYLFDNRYGTGQSTIDGIIRATNILLAGKRFVVGGYGWCGRGVAMRARGMGAHVMVTEVDPTRALEAVMDGFDVLPMERAAQQGDIFVTTTGNTSIICERHFTKIVVRLAAVACAVLFAHTVHRMVTSHLGYFCEPKHTAVLLAEEKPEVASTLFANAYEAEIDGLAWFIGPGAAGDDIGCDHSSCRGGLEELATRGIHGN